MLLIEIVLGENGANVVFGLYVEMHDGLPSPHVVLLHGLGIGMLFTSFDDGNFPIYAWVDYMVRGQYPLSFILNLSCIIMPVENLKVNKVAYVDQAICNSEYSVTRIKFELNTFIETV